MNTPVVLGTLIAVLLTVLVVQNMISEKSEQNGSQTSSSSYEKNSDDITETESEMQDESKESDTQVVPQLPAGTIVDLHGRGLTKVSQDLFTQKNVTQLDLSDNELSGALPAEIRMLRELRVLDLSNNNFTGVPAEVGQLTNLEELNLSNNPITGLPYELAHLTHLRILDLRGTQYAHADLEIIAKGLPQTVTILTDD